MDTKTAVDEIQTVYALVRRGLPEDVANEVAMLMVTNKRLKEENEALRSINIGLRERVDILELYERVDDGEDGEDAEILKEARIWDICC